MSEENSELGILMRMEVNNLAALFYKMQGYSVPEGHDFSESHHPREYGVWNQALVAFAFLKEDETFLKHQVSYKSITG